MRIYLRAIGRLADYISGKTNKTETKVAPGTTISGVLDSYGIPQDEIVLILLNGIRVTNVDTGLNEGDLIEIIPTFAGG